MFCVLLLLLLFSRRFIPVLEERLSYESSAVPGRNVGFTLGTDYSVTYGYDVVRTILSDGTITTGERP